MIRGFGAWKTESCKQYKLKQRVVSSHKWRNLEIPAYDPKNDTINPVATIDPNVAKELLVPPVVQIKTEYPDYEDGEEYIDVFAQHHDKSLLIHNNNNKSASCPKSECHRCNKCGTQFSNRDSVLRHLLVGCVKPNP
ncbi:hypothetical protein M8J77_019943 [Diaphorina citri]|nr:hypothetical protein M8J77_019943 [Diaphorina citri]